MKIIFSRDFPKGLIRMLQEIHTLPGNNGFQVDQLHRDTQEHHLENIAIFLVDKSPKGIEPATAKHFEAGYRVFAYKCTSGKRDSFTDYLTILAVWSDVLKHTESAPTPFVYTISKRKGKAGIKPVTFKTSQKTPDLL